MQMVVTAGQQLWASVFGVVDGCAVGCGVRVLQPVV
jgi:hypothetical protein